LTLPNKIGIHGIHKYSIWDGEINQKNFFKDSS